MKNFLKSIKSSYPNKEFDFLNSLNNDLVNPKNRKEICRIQDIKSPLYRIGKKSRLDSYLSNGIRLKSYADDIDTEYLNENGDPELRAYFFTDINSAMITVLSSRQDLEAIIGNIGEEDSPIILSIDPNKVNLDLVMHEDKELSGAKTNLNSVYFVHADPSSEESKTWKIPASAVSQYDYEEEDSFYDDI